MPTPEEIYVDGMKKRFRHFFATWLPNEKLKLGDVGMLQGNIFIRTNHVSDPTIGISFAERIDTGTAPLDVTSESGVSIVVKGSGETSAAVPNVPKGKAGLVVEFSKQGAFVLKATDVRLNSIENIEKLRQDVLAAFRAGRWEKQWAVVVRLAVAQSATILVSRSSSAKLELLAEGAASAGDVDLGKASLTFSMRSQQGDFFQMIGAENATPIFQLARITKPFFGDTGVQILTSRQFAPLDMVTPESAKTDESLDFALICDEGIKSD